MPPQVVASEKGQKIRFFEKMLKYFIFDLLNDIK